MPKIPCMTCGNEFDVEMPPFEIVRGKKLTVVAILHKEEYNCSACGQAYKYELTGLKQAEYGWKLIELHEEEGSSIIIPPGASK